VQAHLFAYLDGELNPTERQTAQTHLDACALCRADLNQCRQSEHALANALQAVPAAGDLRTGFYARLAAENARPRFNGWRVAVPALAACLLALVVWNASSRHSATSLSASGDAEQGSMAQITPAPTKAAQGSTPSSALPTSSSAVRVATTEKSKIAHPERNAPESRLVGNRIPDHPLHNALPVLRGSVASVRLTGFHRQPHTPTLKFRGDEKGRLAMNTPGHLPNLTAPIPRNAPAFAMYAIDEKRCFNSSARLASDTAEKDAAPLPPDAPFDLKVQDDERGFTSSARLQTDGGAVTTKIPPASDKPF